MSHALLYIAQTLDEAPLPEDIRIQGTDTEHFIHDTFGIDHARHLYQRAHIRPIEKQAREFLVYAQSITHEAQNALLKLFEEPPEKVVFHVVLASEEVLIPTLRSRLQCVAVAKSVSKSTVFEDFLKMDYGKRMEEIATHTKQKDTQWINQLLIGAEQFAIRAASAKQKELLLRSIISIQTYIGRRGASNKMLLEELALSLPSKQ